MNEKDSQLVVTPWLLRAENLCKYYSTGNEKLHILRDLSFHICQGEIVAIVGASGVGKSTLLHLLGGLDYPSAGEVYYQETRLATLNGNQLASFRNNTIGFVFQFHHLLPEFTALENVMLPLLIGGWHKKKAEMQAQQLLSEVNLSNRASHKPGELSGGEQQRVAVARALVRSPKLLLADEPTGNLDTKTSDVVFDLILRLNKEKGVTLVYVTHNEPMAANAERIFRLVDGHIEEVKQ